MADCEFGRQVAARDFVTVMNKKLSKLSEHYTTALRTHLKQGPRASLRPALGLGRQALLLGFETLELARIHERALVKMDLSNDKRGLTRRAELFFTEALTPIVATHRAARLSGIERNRLNGTLGRRTLELVAANRQLKGGIHRRENVERALKKSGEHYAGLLKNSLHLQDKLRQLTHEVLASQECERKKISRGLQNEIAQTLLGINVSLLSLKQKACGTASGLKNRIASTRRLVAKSSKSVRQAAREFKHK